MQCEQCGAGPAGAESFDYCALCGRKLCDECMAGGCCGQVPAISGREREAGAEPAARDGSSPVVDREQPQDGGRP